MRRWLARSGKRHYTFARCEPDEHRDSPTPSLPQSIDSPEVFTYAKRKTVTVGVAARPFGSLRLSVRTPPFHGGESGSIPLGSAIYPRMGQRSLDVKAMWRALSDNVRERMGPLRVRTTSQL